MTKQITARPASLARKEERKNLYSTITVVVGYTKERLTYTVELPNTHSLQGVPLSAISAYFFPIAIQYS